MEILKIWIKEHLLIKYYTVKHLILLQIQNDSGIKNENIWNKELDENVHKTIIWKFKKRLLAPIRDNIWRADMADMQLISKCNQKFRFLLCVIDIYSKYAWVILLKHKKGITITNAFWKHLDKSNHKPNQIWLDKCSEF